VSTAVPWQRLLTFEILQLPALRSYLHSLPYRTERSSNWVPVWQPFLFTGWLSTANSGTRLINPELDCQLRNSPANSATRLPTPQLHCQLRNSTDNSGTRLPTPELDCQLRNSTANSGTRLPIPELDCQLRNSTDNSGTRLTTPELNCQLRNSTANYELTVSIQFSQSYTITTDGQSASLSWNKAPIWGLRPDLYYCQTVAGLLMWGALSDERTGLSFTIAAGYRKHGHSRVRVPWDSWPYFTASDSRLPFSSPPTTRRATVEVFDPASTRGTELKPYSLNLCMVFKNLLRT
jgi:hypothetical protein